MGVELGSVRVVPVLVLVVLGLVQGAQEWEREALEWVPGVQVWGQVALERVLGAPLQVELYNRYRQSSFEPNMND